MRLWFAALLVSSALLVPARAADEKGPDLPTRLKAIKGPFTMLVHLQVKKGEDKKLIAVAKACVAATRKEKGCNAYELHQDQDDPTKFVFYEKWKSVKDLEAHLAAAHTKKLLGHLQTIAAGEPKFSFYTSTE